MTFIRCFFHRAPKGIAHLRMPKAARLGHGVPHAVFAWIDALIG
jgi:hypothetical protein